MDNPAAAADISLPPWLEAWLVRYGAVTAVCGLLALLVAIVFGQTVQHDFIDMDDAQYVFNNSQVRAGLSLQGIAWAFTTCCESNWHPLTWISHELDWQLFGSWAGGHHLTSVLLHALTAIILFLALRRMTGRLGCSALVAALFAIHPLRAESVAWVAERKDVLSGFFFAITLWAYARYAEEGEEGRGGDAETRRRGDGGTWVWYSMVVGFFAMGLMSKPMLVTLPFVLLLLDYWPLGRWQTHLSPLSPSPRLPLSPLPPMFMPQWQLIVEKLPLIALAVASCTVTIWAQRGAMPDIDVLPPGYRVANALVAYGEYVAGTLWPADLAAYYPLPHNGWPAWLIAVSAVTLLGISAVAIWARRRGPWLFSGWFWYLGMLVPVIGLIQVGGQARADRYTYLPQIGLLLALVWGTDALWQWLRLGPRLAIAASTLVVLALVVCAVCQVSLWRDGETVWRHAIACTTENSRAHANLAGILGRRRAYPEAIEQFKLAFEIAPNQPDPLNNYGVTLREAGRLNEAVHIGRLAVELKPDSPTLHENLAVTLTRRGLWDEAIGEYQKELELRPDDFPSRFNLAQIYARLGRAEDAVREYRAVAAAAEDFPDIHFYLANALSAGRAYQAAVEEYRKALERRPDAGEAWHNLGMTLQRSGRPDEALGALVKAVQCLPGNAEYRYYLAVLLRDVGKTKEAAEQLQQAVGLAPFVAAYRRELAGALMRFGRSGEAIVHYQAALKISAGDVEAQRGLATALLAEGKTAEAIGYYQAVLKISATDGEAQRGLGLALMARGKVDEAMEVLRKLPAGPKSAAAINQLALALAGKGKTAEATRGLGNGGGHRRAGYWGAAQPGGGSFSHGTRQRGDRAIPRGAAIESGQRPAKERFGLDLGNVARCRAAERQRGGAACAAGGERERREAACDLGHLGRGLRGGGPVPGCRANGQRGPATGHGGAKRASGRVAPQADRPVQGKQAVPRLGNWSEITSRFRCRAD